jgi:hypothetical protein
MSALNKMLTAREEKGANERQTANAV